MKILKTCSYIVIIFFTILTSFLYVYTMVKAPSYKVNIPQKVEGDIISGDINGNKNIQIYLSKDCIYCKKWIKENKKDFENFAMNNNIRIIYRNINIYTFLKQKDKNTEIFYKRGIINTPSYVYDSYYYKGAPNPQEVLTLINNKNRKNLSKNNN